MTYLQSTGSQLALCLYSIGFGCLLGIAYEAVRFARVSLGVRRSAALWDVLFGAAAAFAAFLFDLLHGDGRMRVYLLASKCVGFWIWYTFAAPVVRQQERRLQAGMRRVSAYICAPLIRFAGRMEAWAAAWRKKHKKTIKKRKKNKKSSCFFHLLWCIL